MLTNIIIAYLLQILTISNRTNNMLCSYEGYLTPQPMGEGGLNLPPLLRCYALYDSNHL